VQLQLFGPLETELQERARRAREKLCLDCDIDTIAIAEYYVVEEAVWLQANPGSKGMLCIGCLEVRLGRRLTPADFTDSPINDRSSWQSPRLR
jgi:hypothetical protein